MFTNLKIKIFSGKANNKGFCHYGKVGQSGFHKYENISFIMNGLFQCTIKRNVYLQY